jgi:hypothetical protein
LLQGIINEHIEIYAPREESIRLTAPALKQIIIITAKQRDEWDDSPNKITWKTTFAGKRLSQVSMYVTLFTLALIGTVNFCDSR